MDTVRAFFAVEIGASAASAVARVVEQLRGRKGGGNVRFVRQESLHVTLRFLGDVPVADLGGLVAAVGKELAGVAPFDLSLGEPMAFPDPRRARVLALALAPAEPLIRAAVAVERGAVAAGLAPEERPFRPHLTLGRVKGGPPPVLEGIATPAHEAFSADGVVLLQSELHLDGARYTPLERVPFGGR